MNSWKQTGTGNEILEMDGFYLSYNPDCRSGLVGLFDRAFLGISQEKETAIVWQDKCLILNGDHRVDLEGREIEECLGYFLRNEDQHGPTSDRFVL